MPDLLRQTVQKLLKSESLTCSWVLWKPHHSEFQIVDAQGFAAEDVKSLSSQWDGHHELLQHAFAKKTVQRATANNQHLQKSSESKLFLVAIPVIQQEHAIAVLEIFFRTQNQADAFCQSDCLQKHLPEIAQQLSRHQAEAASDSLAAYLSELVLKTPPAELPHAIANAICVKHDVDRCSLFLCSEKKAELLGISGHQDYEPRSQIIGELHRLVTEFASSSFTPFDEIKIPADQLAQLNSQSAICISLGEISQQNQPSSSQQNFLVLCLEFFKRDCPESLKTELSNAIPTWKLAMQSSQAGTGLHSKRSKKAVFFVILVLACLLMFLPTNLTIHAPGKLMPVTRQNLFAPESGLIKSENLHLPAEQRVEKNQHLLTITNQDLQLLSSQLDGKLATTSEEIRSLKNRRPQRETESVSPLSIDQDTSIRLAELQARFQGLQQEKELLQQRIQSLEIRSPLQGTLLSWDAKQQLAGRPVSRGQLLLTLGDIQGEWEVLVEVAQPDIGLLKKVILQKKALQKANSSYQKVPFTATLDSSSDDVWQGEEIEISPSVYQKQTGEYVLPVKGKLASKIEEIRPGTQVTLHISCGKYPMGYVLFRSVIDAIRSRMTW